MKKIIISIISLLYFQSYAQIQIDSLTEIVTINPIIISANRIEQPQDIVSQQVSIIKRKDILFQNTQTTAELLSNSGSLFVQKSQLGGGSPVIRGFEASRVLLMIDGVRMNNLIYRSGHLQNVITTDPTIMDRVEVLYGPSSTAYGSDALGGVIHIRTIDPKFSTTDKSLVGGNVSFRYGTVNQEKTTHAHINFGTKKFASLTSITYSDFGDLVMGKQAGSLDSVWGLRKYYVERINGKDSLVKNDDEYKQIQSAYKQVDVMQKFSFMQDENNKHQLNIQFSNSSDVPRYDRLTDPKGTGLNSAEWYYGPQKRLMASYNFNHSNDNKFFNLISAGANYQSVQESRNSRGFNGSYLTSRVEDVTVSGLDLDITHKTKDELFRIGAEGFYETLASTATKKGVNQDTSFVTDTRYPDGDNNRITAAVYVSYSKNYSKKLTLNTGFRAQYIKLYSQFVSQEFFPFPFNEVNQANTGLSGNIGLNYFVNDKLKIGIASCTGFRAPNVDDLSKVFESGKGKLVVPNPDIKPEKTYNLELNITKYFSDKVRWENVAFYTIFNDAIVVDNFTFNGASIIVYDGDTSSVVASQNKAEAYVYGFNSNIQADITKNISATATVTYTYGRVKTDSTYVPLDHIPPFYGRVGVNYHTQKFNSELYTLFNSAKNLENYSTSGEDNIQYATSEGMPSWYTLNLKIGYQVSKNLTIQTGIENILDQNYRTFASGIQAPGRNIFGTLRVNF